MTRLLAGFLALFLGVTAAGAPVAEEGDGFLVRVLLETEEPVYELSCAYELDGEPVGEWGVCAANGRSPLGGEVFNLFRMEDFPEGADLSSFSMRFSLTTAVDGELCPVENEFSVPAAYGATCRVTILGSAEGGYRAE
ncbi:MAG: hypothetical protein IJ048_05805 [Clostridia bacterium]|nr:hypothetical protein [Clostridia bacterium]